jgi:hypothetical protein
MACYRIAILRIANRETPMTTADLLKAAFDSSHFIRHLLRGRLAT